VTDRTRARLLGGLVGIPFGLVAAWAVAVVFGGTVQGTHWPAEMARALALPAAAVPAAALGPNLATATVAPRLAEPRADRLMTIVRWILASHGLAAAITIALVIAGGSVDLAALPVALVKFAGTFVGASWLYAIAGAMWVAAAGRAIRRDAPATPEEQSASSTALNRLIRQHVRDDATLLAPQDSTSRRWRD
jgi:hypothetical protein